MTPLLKTSTLAALAMLAAGALGTAQAASFQIDFTGNNYNYTFGAPVPSLFSASLLVTTAGDAASFEAVQSISGTINGETITGLSVTFPTGWTDNNLFTAASPYLNDHGIFFSTSTVNWRISTANGTGMLIYNMDRHWYVAPGSGAATVTALASPTPAVPEPDTYALFLAGLGVTGAVARRRKR